MSCHLTEKISLLIDGELGAEEAKKLTKHLSGCASCQLAREDFLHLRQQLSTIEVAPQLNLQQQAALRNILAARADLTASPSASKKSRPALMPGRLRERLAEAFSPQRYSPALLSTLALILIGVIALAAYLSLRNSTRDQRTTDDNRVATLNKEAPRKAQVADDAVVKPSPEPLKLATTDSRNDSSNPSSMLKTQANAGIKAVRTSIAGANRTSITRSLPVPGARKVNGERANESQPGILPSTESSSEPVVESTAVAASTPNTTFFRINRYSAGNPRDLTARHVEQAQLLLRAFRNARPSVQDSTSDISYEQARSKKLLYQNIMLRREAANAGNLPVEKLLSRLEPILIDIANLPARPADDDVRSIKERMQKRNIVAMLQVSLTPAARFN